MKKVWHHPEAPNTGKRYWRSLGELEETPEFREWLEREFPQGAAELADEREANVSRRNFLKLMGASTSLAGFGMAACRRPEAFLVPFSEHVEWSVPGRPLMYASAMPRLGGCSPLVVTTHEGRPTHVQGNLLHPSAGKGTDVFAQASVLDLYDPDRSRDFLKDGRKVGMDAFEAALGELKGSLAAVNGQGLAVLVGESTSPTRARLLAELREKFPSAAVYRYEAISLDHVRAANKAAFGPGVHQVPNLAKAKRILSLDCDFLGLDRIATNPVTDFMTNRRVDDGKVAGMNRLYAVETNYTVTGGMADHRLRANAGQIARIAASIAKAVGAASVGNSVDALSGGLDEATAKWVAAAAKDLSAHRGESVVLAGLAQPAAVHVLAAAINDALGAFGSTIALVESDEPEYGTLAELAAAIGESKVNTLVITTDADPAYDAPADLKWAETQRLVGNVIHLGVRHRTQTARQANWHVPGAHYLESWSDVRAADGTYSVVQPMILPLYGGWSETDLLLALLRDEPVPAAEGEAAAAVPAAMPGAEEAASPAYEAVRATFAAMVDGDVEKAWNATLRDGFLAGSTYPAASGRIDAAGAGAVVSGYTAPAQPALSAFEVVFRPDAKIYDGRFINNGWLQEAPDPITKLTWDNAALVSIATARELGIRRDGQLVKIEVNGQSAHFPVLQAPGHADYSLTLPLGYGQPGTNGSGPGRVGEKTGFNAYPLRTSKNPLVASGAKVTVVKEAVTIDDRRIPAIYPLALTQEHNSMYGRAIVREGTVERFAENPDFALREGMDAHIPENISFYKPENRKGEPLINDEFHQWAMTIDLNQCIGCSACQVACQSENNIPIVGKEQVIIGREMHWIRMDRYFATADPKKDKDTQNSGAVPYYEDAENWANPEMVPQPVACHHCDLAPCETVCPVNATVHNEEGLNVMAYNRCIGTRYCANNCPYKARRFNFFDYNKRPLDELYKGPLSSPEKTGMRESLALQKNPNVTVRMRGVMEKCTYCVQRIEEGKIKQLRAARDSGNKRVATGAVRTACQEACPAEAVVFGNLRDPNDPVNASKASPRNYDLLAYIGVLPRTSYLARIKNPNPEMPGADAIGQISAHIH